MIQLYNIILIKKTPINRLAHIKLSKKGNVDYIIYKTFIKWEGGSIKDILNSIFFFARRLGQFNNWFVYYYYCNSKYLSKCLKLKYGSLVICIRTVVYWSKVSSATAREWLPSFCVFKLLAGDIPTGYSSTFAT